MKKILPILLVLIGIGGGGAAGFFLKPAPPEPDSDEAMGEASGQGEGVDTLHGGGDADAAEPAERSFVKIGRQTIIPVVEGGETRALMLFELAVDVPAARSDDVHEMEPRLRDAFLRELFKMAYTGAFLTNFTDDRVIEELRRNLTRAAQRHLGKDATEVLILDVMRQEM